MVATNIPAAYSQPLHMYRSPTSTKVIRALGGKGTEIQQRGRIHVQEKIMELQIEEEILSTV